MQEGEEEEDGGESVDDSLREDADGSFVSEQADTANPQVAPAAALPTRPRGPLAIDPLERTPFGLCLVPPPAPFVFGNHVSPQREPRCELALHHWAPRPPFLYDLGKQSCMPKDFWLLAAAAPR